MSVNAATDTETDMDTETDTDTKTDGHSVNVPWNCRVSAWHVANLVIHYYI